ncbi:TetR/AcrR family transcriptional regulator [Planococcus glaciei]|uniref:TetR/AcrR family transcriptional regulator n=1 Tax=Planococcus glaciei TaxID=459472 RepID=A0A7H8QC40_9BACL|nr:TetR/AcrR family transcriptional regulator [Planococcus glaciei]MBX0315276.1 TetR/AcrR family transcriptional regulator [Planococcus glaciei]QDY45828.1 TetR/AcrR family transcriptional regulator [Planococcus glaciei]QKX51071.1 TetR/AcrR family transcriptional regulator [Planococcus glaciei]
MADKKENLSPQAERTKHQFKQAFTELINEKGFNHVSVTDIVQRAQYNRATFYLYYLDKPDITEELRSEMFQQIKQTSKDRYIPGKEVATESMNEDSFGLVTFIYDNRSFFNLYLKEDTIPGLYQDLPRAIFELFDEQFTFTPVGDHDINSPAFKLYMAHGTAGLILDWAKNGYQKSPIEVSRELIGILQAIAVGFRVE